MTVSAPVLCWHQRSGSMICGASWCRFSDNDRTVARMRGAAELAELAGLLELVVSKVRRGAPSETAAIIGGHVLTMSHASEMGPNLRLKTVAGSCLVQLSDLNDLLLWLSKACGCASSAQRYDDLSAVTVFSDNDAVVIAASRSPEPVRLAADAASLLRDELFSCAAGEMEPLSRRTVGPVVIASPSLTSWAVLQLKGPGHPQDEYMLTQSGLVQLATLLDDALGGRLQPSRDHDPPHC